MWELDAYVPVVPVSSCLHLSCLKSRITVLPTHAVVPGARCSRSCEKPGHRWSGGHKNTPGQGESGTGARELGFSIPRVRVLGFSAFSTVIGAFLPGFAGARRYVS